jgi:hypothetical protein
MMKNYMTTRTFARSNKPEGDLVGKVAAPFLEEKTVTSIYGGPATHELHRRLKLTARAINSVSAAVLEYLRWSKFLITFDRMDHPDSIPKRRRFPRIMDPLIGTTRLSKALMDGGSGLNLMYLDTFEESGLTQDPLQRGPHQFYGVVLGKHSTPVGRVTQPVTFRDASNYQTEMLASEVVDFSSPYHVILGWLCYVKFMAIPSYAYLKLKIHGPTRVITMEAKTQWALDCEQSSIELAAAMVTAAEQREISIRLPMVLLSPKMPPMFSILRRTRMPRPCKSTLRTQPKLCRSGPAWILNRKASSSTFSNAIETCLHGA